MANPIVTLWYFQYRTWFGSIVDWKLQEGWVGNGYFLGGPWRGFFLRDRKNLKKPAMASINRRNADFWLMVIGVMTR